MNNNTQEKLLLIENDSAWAKTFITILRDLGESREIEILDSKSSLRERYGDTKSFDNVAACIVDLELEEGYRSNIGDKFGLHDVLPFLRESAPWIPVACLSRYIDGDSQIIAELSASEFDFFAPKSFVTQNKGANNELQQQSEFNVSKWKWILRSMSIQRVSALSGRPLRELTASLKTLPSCDQLPNEILDSLKNLKTNERAFQEGLALLGLEGSEFSVYPIDQGFSGINVSRVIATGHEENEQVHSCWLVKWGRPIAKLAAEAHAHKRLLRRGLERSLQIPQLLPNVLPWEGVGYIAYAFERDAKTALDYAKTEGISALAEPLKKLASGLYGTTTRCKAINADNVIAKWCDAGSTKNNASQLEVSWTFIHGDLHLRNIFIRNDAPTLIDFARSDPGPVAVDAAKLFIDSLVFVIDNFDEWPTDFTMAKLLDSGLRPLVDAFRPFLSQRDDKRFLTELCRAFSNKYLQYPDVDIEQKEQLRKILGS